jgi:hypothetical protein
MVRPPKENATKAQLDNYSADVALAAKLEAAGIGWDDIAKQIKGKLTPENRDYFTVRACDCPNHPENATILHDLYKDPDGRIRTLPIVLILPEIGENLPYTLECWGASEIRYWCEEDDDGDKVCVAPASYTKGTRPFGGRNPRVVRPCDPETCPEYQAHECNFNGFIQGIVPGVIGAGVCRISTGSWYSFKQMEGKLTSIYAVTQRIHGLVKEGTDIPILKVVKVGKQEISRYDEEKDKTFRVKQDLIHLEMDTTMIALMSQFSPAKQISAGQRAKALLNGERPKPKEDPEPEPQKDAPAATTEQSSVVAIPTDRNAMMARVVELQGTFAQLAPEKYEVFHADHIVYQKKSTNDDLRAHIELLTQEIARLEPPQEEIIDGDWQDMPGEIPDPEDAPL